MAASSTSRLAYIDWMRGLACVLMFQTHCYDAWLNPESRKTTFFMWSQLGGTLPAPLFLFLAGISFALVTDKLRQKGLPPNQIARTTIRRGAEILGLGLLFRLQEYVIAWGWAPWSDLLRVDILNTIGLSMMLMGVDVLDRAQAEPGIPRPAGAGCDRGWSCSADFSADARCSGPPGVRNGCPGRSNRTSTACTIWASRSRGSFPIFPWTAFAFAGLAVGFFLLSDWARKRDAAVFALAGAGGVGLIYLARWLDARPWQLYSVYDFWHTSPNFFLIRVGLLLVILAAAYAWCRWGAGQWGFSPLIQLGQTSLLVYWVHIEFVYGRLSILPKQLGRHSRRHRSDCWQFFWRCCCYRYCGRG